MIAQIGLSILLAGIMVYAWTEYARAPAIGLVGLLVAAAGLYFVWLPDHATWLATRAGIGRGVDLIIYVWVVISLLVMLNLHLKLRAQTELITALAREVAIANARSPATTK
jgi:small membrane protein